MEKRIEELNTKLVELSATIENMQKKYNFSVYKKWQTNAGKMGFDGKPVEVCEFCSGLEGKEVPYNSLWEHTAPAGTSPSSGKHYTGLRPGSVHVGCRCSFSIVIK